MKIDSLGPNYYKDENDQWWYDSKSSKTHRQRAEIINCENCGEEGVVRSSYVRKGKGRFCSVLCASTNRWKGGRRITDKGYVRVVIERGGYSGGKRSWTNSMTVLEHRLVMEKMLGRPLEDHERVHHKNGVRHDNRPENLELWTLKKDPPGTRVTDHLVCKDCGSKHIVWEHDLRKPVPMELVAA